MTITHIPTRAELVSTAREIAPILQEHANWNEQHGHLHDQSIEALEQAGLFRLRTPQRYGGYEWDPRTLVEVLSELAQGGGSTGGVAQVLLSHTVQDGQFHC